MNAVANLFNKESSSNNVFDGIIARNVASTADLAPVIVPAFDPDLIFTEAPWMPRGSALPMKGDRCVVILGDTNHPGTPEAWIPAWWNGGVVAYPGGAPGPVGPAGPVGPSGAAGAVGPAGPAGAGIGPSVKLTRATDQNIGPNSAATIISWSAVTGNDPAALWSALNPTRVTAKTAGRWLIESAIRWADAPSAWRRIQYLVNGAPAPKAESFIPLPQVSTATSQHLLAILDLAANDYVEVEATAQYGGSGAGAAIASMAANSFPWITATRLMAIP